MCTPAYREALIRELSPASPAPALPQAPVPSQRQSPEAGSEGGQGEPIPHRAKLGHDDLESRGAAAAATGAQSEAVLALA